MSFSERLQSLKFRTLDELLNEVKTDLVAYEQESSIQTSELIKIAQLCNYDLGLRIHQTKEAIIDVSHGRAKLPADFQIMNFALACYNYTVTWNRVGYPTGYGQEVVTSAQPLAATRTTCPCWTVVSLGAQTIVTNCDGTSESVYFPPNDDSTARTVTICAQTIASHPNLTLTEGSGCYWDALNGYSCTYPTVSGCTCDTPVVDECLAIDPDPWDQSRTRVQCNGDTATLKIIEQSGGWTRAYTDMEYVQFVPSRHASAFCNVQLFPDCRLQAQIKNGFVYLGEANCDNIYGGYGYGDGTTTRTHRMYINYQGILEDDDGNLMVLDHPMINMYYEAAIKTRILENIYFNTGEERARTLWKEMKEEYKQWRQKALAISNTPEVYEMRQTYQLMRKEQEYKYFVPFNKYFGDIPGLWSINQFII